MPQVILETQHGHCELSGNPADTIADVLRRVRVPLSAIWTYSRHKDGSTTFMPSSTKIGDLTTDAYARANRNVDLLGLSHLAPSRERDTANATSEWTFPGVGGAPGIAPKRG